MSYSHLVEIDEQERKLHIFRVWQGKEDRQLFTSVELPSKSFDEDEEGFRRFATLLGENLLFDSPIARRLLLP